jgi:Intracellular proteinase inhibitor
MLHLFHMKFVAFLICLMPVTLFGQGVRMSGDFLPLEVGNRWVYDIENEGGQKIGSVDFSIKEHRIIGGRSYYVLSGFPFTPDDGSLDRLIRYDRQERQYMRMLDNEEGPLFLADGATAEVLQADNSGLPLKFILRMDLFDLTFQRGVGVIEARIHGGNSVQIAKLSAMRVGGPPPTAQASLPSVVNPNAPPPPLPKPPDQKPKNIDNVAKISDENPALDVQVVAVSGGHKFVLNVFNTSDKLLPFDFTSGQTYDFAVFKLTGQEVWRWSRRQFFTQVLRKEAIRPNKNWTFEVTWNNRDNDLNPIEPGTYAVVGIVATQPPIESSPAMFEIK